MECKPSNAVRLIVFTDEIASCSHSGLAMPVLAKILTDCGFDDRYRVVLWSEWKKGCPAGAQPYALVTGCITQSAKELSEFAVCVSDYDCDLAMPAGDTFPETCRSLTYSATSDNADFTARNVRNFQEKGYAFEMVGVGVIGRIQLRSGTEQAVRGSLIAASAALTCGIPFAEVLGALNEFSIAHLEQS